MGPIIIPSKWGRIKSPFSQSIHQGIFNGSLFIGEPPIPSHSQEQKRGSRCAKRSFTGVAAKPNASAARWHSSRRSMGLHLGRWTEHAGDGRFMEKKRKKNNQMMIDFGLFLYQMGCFIYQMMIYQMIHQKKIWVVFISGDDGLWVSSKLAQTRVWELSSIARNQEEFFFSHYKWKQETSPKSWSIFGNPHKKKCWWLWLFSMCSKKTKGLNYLSSRLRMKTLSNFCPGELAQSVLPG